MLFFPQLPSADGDSHLAADYGHFHALPHTEATDSDGDGFSDAVELGCSTDPFTASDHPAADLDVLYASGSRALDVDADGYSDALEALLGTACADPASHPFVVEAHHFPAGSDHNLPGTYDLQGGEADAWRLP